MYQSFLKSKSILILMIQITTQVEIGKIHFYNIFEYLLFKCVFGLENVFNKSYSFLCDKIHGCILHMI
jgi:hypothetical protein